MGVDDVHSNDLDRCAAFIAAQRKQGITYETFDKALNAYFDAKSDAEAKLDYRCRRVINNTNRRRNQ